MFKAMAKGHLEDTTVLMGDTAADTVKTTPFSLPDLGVQRVHEYSYRWIDVPAKDDKHYHLALGMSHHTGIVTQMKTTWSCNTDSAY